MHVGRRCGTNSRVSSHAELALILQLHRWEVEHHHGPIGDPNVKPYGNGVLLWFEVEDFDAGNWKP